MKHTTLNDAEKKKKKVRGACTKLRISFCEMVNMLDLHGLRTIIRYKLYKGNDIRLLLQIITKRFKRLNRGIMMKSWAKLIINSTGTR